MGIEPDDLILWPDGDFCTGEQLSEMGHKSDDFEVIPFGTPRYQTLAGELGLL